MSAFVVPDNHIRYLVGAAQAYGVSYYQPDDTARFGVTLQSAHEFDHEICQKLLDENYRSVNARYRDEYGQAPAIRYRPVMRAITPTQVIKACDCYDYQACETGDYDKTPQHRFIAHLRDVAISRLPGYESAAWTID